MSPSRCQLPRFAVFLMGSNMTMRLSDVPEKQSRPFKYRSENSDMAFTAEAVREEMQGHISSLVALVPEGSRKTALSYAARVLGLPFGRVRSLYYGEARRIDAHEADKVRAYVQAAQKLIDARADYERQRLDFLAANPALARFAPGPLPRTQALEEAEQAVADAAKGRP